MKKVGDEIKKLRQLSILIGVRIAKVFPFMRKYVGVKTIMYPNVTFIVREHWRSCFCSFSKLHPFLDDVTGKAIFWLKV